MTMLRRVLAIATRSFYRPNRQHIKSLNKISYRNKSSSFYLPSSRLLHHHYHAYSTSSSSPTTPTKPVITIEQSSKLSLRRQLIFIAAVTTLSYIGYKYFNYDNKHEQETKPKESNALQNLIEKQIINYNMAFKMGLFFDNNKRYERALYFYKLYLRKPNTKQGEYAALNNMAIIYYKLNEYENALIVFELLGHTQIRERNLEFLCAHCHHSVKHYQDALKYYHKFLNNSRSKQPDLSAAYNNMALLYYELGRYDKAIEYFQKIGDEVIKQKNYGFRVAHTLQNLKQFEKSLEYYNLYLSNPNTTNINLQNTYHNLGVLFYDNGRDQEAMNMFTKLGDAELKERNLEFKMAHLCAKLGDKQSAIKYLKECKNKPEIYGEYAIICQGIMAQLLYECNEYKQAAKEFNELGEAEIIKQDLYFPAGFTYFQCGEYEKALKYYYLLLDKKGSKLNPDEVRYIYSRISLIYYKQKDYVKTLEILTTKLNNTVIEKWNLEFILAHSSHKLRRYNEAVIYYEKFLANKTSDKLDVINAYQNLGLLYYDLNEFAKSISYFNLVGEEKLSERHLEFYVAHSYQEMDGNKEAMKYYKLYLKNIDKSDEKNTLNIMNAYQNLGTVYYDIEEWENASKMFLNLSDMEILNRNLGLKVSKCYKKMGDKQNELKYLKLAANKPNYMESVNMAKMYYNMYQNELAINIFKQIGDEEIIKNNVEFVAAHSYQLIGDNRNAIKYYKMGIENKENMKDIDGVHRAYHNMGCAYHDMKEYKNAIEYFEKIPTSHINKTNVEFIIAVSYHNLEQHQKALEYYKMYLRNPLSEDSENVLSCYNNMIVLYYYALNDYENAWGLIQKMNDDTITEKKLEFESAHCAQQLNKNDISMKYYKLFLKNNNNDLNDEMIINVYNNVLMMNQNDKHFMNDTVETFKKSGNKHKELQLFVEWMKENKSNVK